MCFGCASWTKTRVMHEFKDNNNQGSIISSGSAGKVLSWRQLFNLLSKPLTMSTEMKYLHKPFGCTFTWNANSSQNTLTALLSRRFFVYFLSFHYLHFVPVNVGWSGFVTTSSNYHSLFCATFTCDLNLPSAEPLNQIQCYNNNNNKINRSQRTRLKTNYTMKKFDDLPGHLIYMHCLFVFSLPIYDCHKRSRSALVLSMILGHFWIQTHTQYTNTQQPTPIIIINNKNDAIWMLYVVWWEMNIEWYILHMMTANEWVFGCMCCIIFYDRWFCIHTYAHFSHGLSKFHIIWHIYYTQSRDSYSEYILYRYHRQQKGWKHKKKFSASFWYCQLPACQRSMEFRQIFVSYEKKNQKKKRWWN